MRTLHIAQLLSSQRRLEGAVECPIEIGLLGDGLRKLRSHGGALATRPEWREKDSKPRFEPWRNRIEFLEGRDAIKAFLTRKMVA